MSGVFEITNQIFLLVCLLNKVQCFEIISKVMKVRTCGVLCLVIQSWVYSGVALIPFQVYSRSGVDPLCSTPWSRTYAARLIPFHWSRGVSFYSGLLQRLNFSRQNISDAVLNKLFEQLF